MLPLQMFTAARSTLVWTLALRMLLFATFTSAVALPNLPGYTEYPHINCFHDHGAINIDSGTNASTKTLRSCAAFCDATPNCHCVVYDANPTAQSKCFRREVCAPKQCDAGTAWNTFVKPGGPPLPPQPAPSPTPPPTPPPPAPTPGAACKDCPNILLMFTDDQDEILGGWKPMAQTREAIGQHGATATQWRIHTPICAASRSELQSGRYFHNIKSEYPTPGAVVSSGAVHHIDLGHKVWPYVFPTKLREEKGYRTGLFGKCMNLNCGRNKYANGSNLHTMGAFDRWFEGTGYQNGEFYDNKAESCGGWPWPEDSCITATNTSTIGAGYLTSELGNRTIAWLHDLDAAAKADPSAVRRPWFVYFATHAPHGPATPAAWYKDACPGVVSPRVPNYNYTGKKTTACTLFPPSRDQGSTQFNTNGSRAWWNGTDLPELTSCQPAIDANDAALIDLEARNRCRTLMSVDDTYVAILRAVEALGQLKNTYTIISSDHGYNLGHHMLVTAKMQIYEHSLRIPTLFMGPGILANSTFSFLGTQVDYAPTILALANIPVPSYMDGTDLVPLLVAPTVATAQSDPLPGSVARSLHRTRNAPRPTRRDASFHQYYNQGPWKTGCGHLPSSNWCQPARHRLDDWSNTWAAIVYQPNAAAAAATLTPVGASSDTAAAVLLYKYGVFDPWGKQSNFAQGYMHVLFNLTCDPYELDNIYNATKETKAGATLIATMETKLRAYITCKGNECRLAAGEIV